MSKEGAHSNRSEKPCQGVMCTRVRISGRVQGVGYRAWTRECAITNGVSGWVRNCVDGSVEAFLSGKTTAVGRVVAEMRVGPRFAAVERVEALSDELTAEASREWAQSAGEQEFKVLRGEYPSHGEVRGES